MLLFLFFFFNDTATTEIYTLSLPDALPISNEIFVIDFGLAKPFLNNGERLPFSANLSFLGTYQFASRAAHFCIEQCPWDDLESLAYTLVSLLRPSPDDDMAMQSSEALCDGLPNELRIFLDECRGTTDVGDRDYFESRFQRPVDYAALRQLLKAALDEAQSSDDRSTKRQKTN